MSETCYLGRDNAFAKQLVLDGTPLTPAEMAAITRVDLIYLGVSYSSSSFPTAFDWVSKASDATVVFKPGNIPTIPAGRDKEAEFIVYAPDYPDGIVWGHIDLKMIDLGV
jgi:hypothetical protein